jgi:hypothetical protein
MVKESKLIDNQLIFIVDKGLQKNPTFKVAILNVVATNNKINNYQILLYDY